MRKLEFDIAALEDLIWWAGVNIKKTIKILQLIEMITRDPFQGIGKPEPLKGNLAGFWSRRIDTEHRIIYQVLTDKIRILSCRYHYFE